ncbi:MAG: DUF3298 domain-containing protein [Treponema sp.]
MKKLLYAALFTAVLSAGNVFAKDSMKRTALYTMTRAQEMTDKIEADIEYPVFAGKKDLNKEVEKLVFGGYRTFKAETDPLADGRLYYGVTCAPVSANDEFISALFTVYTYAGGANGETKLASLTYSPRDKEFLSITDATGLSLDELSKVCTEKLSAMLPSSDSELIKSGAAAKAENFRNFTFDGSLLTVYFEPYQVAPHSEGVVKVAIPVGAMPYSEK